MHHATVMWWLFYSCIAIRIEAYSNASWQLLRRNISSSTSSNSKSSCMPCVWCCDRPVRHTGVVGDLCQCTRNILSPPAIVTKLTSHWMVHSCRSYNWDCYELCVCSMEIASERTIIDYIGLHSVALKLYDPSLSRLVTLRTTPTTKQ